MRVETWKLGRNFSHAVKARKLGRAIVLAFINIREVLVPLGNLMDITQHRLQSCGKNACGLVSWEIWLVSLDLNSGKMQNKCYTIKSYCNFMCKRHDMLL